MLDVNNTGNSNGAGKREYMGILLSVYLNLKFLWEIKPIPKNKFSTLISRICKLKPQWTHTMIAHPPEWVK